MVAELAARLEILTRIEPAEGSRPERRRWTPTTALPSAQKGHQAVAGGTARAGHRRVRTASGNSPRELGKQIGALAAGLCPTVTA